jgi:GT2 family glycosyltransferase
MLHILTLTWNKCDKLTRLRESLIPALEGIAFNWIIKDNASIDNTRDVASTWGDKVKVIKYKDNLQNFSQGMNYIFNAASPTDNDLILFLNNDVVFGDNTSIKNMISLLKDDVGVVGAKLLYTGTKRLQHAGVIFPNHGLPLNYRRGDMDDANASQNRYFQAVTGAVAIMKASTYKNICTTNKSGINGLCEELIWCFDDIDACLSIINNQKKKIVYCGETNVFHDESASLKENPVNKLFMDHNVKVFSNKWRGRYINDLDRYATNHKYNLVKHG